ncbi:galectin-1-like [Rana temporaria]|uniref:galectin-1-like n=1 Tax=Rana temporaria TaxID=8407 RepID=UPI001AACD8E9|nr:galectin-1-like [Rana temporaria]
MGNALNCIVGCWKWLAKCCGVRAEVGVGYVRACLQPPFSGIQGVIILSFSPLQAIVLYNFNLKPGHSVEVGGFIPKDCKRFSINLGKGEKNVVLHFNPRFEALKDDHKIILNSMVGDVYGEERRESFFPFQEGSDTTVSFQFEKEKIIIQLPTGNPLSFPIRFPIEAISYLSVEDLQLKSITLK